MWAGVLSGTYDNDGRLGFGMLLLEVAITVVLARKLTIAEGVSALESCTGTVDSSVVPLPVFPKGKAFDVSTVVKFALERPLVRVSVLTRLMH
jgi:hypothetical protein